MKPSLLLCFFLCAFVVATAQDTKPQGINAKFIFFQNGDSVDTKNPTIRLNADLSFKIQSRKQFKTIKYQLIAGGSPSGAKTVQGTSNDGYVSLNAVRYSLRAGDKLSVEILEMTDDEGVKFKPAKTTYNFTFN